MFSGVKNTISSLSVDLSYMLWHNLFLDAGVFMRKQSNALLPTTKENLLFRFGMRLNIAAIDYRH